MATVKLPQDFKEFLQLLSFHKVEYLLVGGYAVGYHGYPRATVDMDVWVRISEQNAVRIVKTLQDFGFSVPELSAELFLQSDKIIRMGVPPLRLEILTSVSGLAFQDTYNSRIVDDLDGVETSIISLKDLKANKAAAGRYKDLEDLAQLP